MSNITEQNGADERVVTVDSGAIIAAQLPATVVNAGVPTQVANPSRSSWRTFAQSAFGFLLVLNAAALVLLPFVLDPANGLAEALGPVYGWLVLALNAITFVGATVSKLAALFMANPIVNAWITRHVSFLAPIKPPTEN